MTTCRDVSELATDYREGTLPRREWVAMRLHLLVCRMCRAYLDQLDKAASLLRGRAMAAPAAELQAKLVAAATSSRSSRDGEPSEEA